jgi:hypothetical protein
MKRLEIRDERAAKFYLIENFPDALVIDEKKVRDIIAKHGFDVPGVVVAVQEIPVG